MSIPIHLGDLPAPSPERAGWPWTECSPILPPTRPDGSAWPAVSIVTPSYQQAQFLEETIRSVLLQGYPRLEYIIIDGGSTDGCVDIIRKYEKWITWWVSERDRGQVSALNKGWEKCTGDIWAWLNSDDVYLPGTLSKVIRAFDETPETRIVYGSAIFTDKNSQPVMMYYARPLPPGMDRLKLWKGWALPQPGSFFDGRLITKYGPLDEHLHFAFDCEWFLRVTRNEKFKCIEQPLATYRWHEESKTGVEYSNKNMFATEQHRIMRKYAPLRYPCSWPLYLAEFQDIYGPSVRKQYLRLHAFVRRIYGGTRRRIRSYAGKVRRSSN